MGLEVFVKEFPFTTVPIIILEGVLAVVSPTAGLVTSLLLTPILTYAMLKHAKRFRLELAIFVTEPLVISIVELVTPNLVDVVVWVYPAIFLVALIVRVITRSLPLE